MGARTHTHTHTHGTQKERLPIFHRLEG
jgi:hypothetical protein